MFFRLIVAALLASAVSLSPGQSPSQSGPVDPTILPLVDVVSRPGKRPGIHGGLRWKRDRDEWRRRVLQRAKCMFTVSEGQYGKHR